jgi:hypothetical protein
VQQHSTDPFDGATPEAARMLRTYFDGERLKSMPRAGQRRQVVLEHLVTRFEVGVHYSEAEVNDLLRSAHSDVAALRRYLVDAGLLDRAHGEYWRSGGWVDV